MVVAFDLYIELVFPQDNGVPVTMCVVRSKRARLDIA